MKKTKLNSKAQDEMVGFALILIIVAVIFIIFLSAYIRKPIETTVDHEADSFVQSLLQYTTVCEENNFENLTVQKLIFRCNDRSPCYPSGLDSCIVLNNTIKEITKESWEFGPENYIKGYSITINLTQGSSEEQFLNINEGVVTRNYRRSLQDFGKGWDYTKILFKVYT